MPLYLQHTRGLSPTQRRGWEPNAILNWLALAGWGVNHAEEGKPTSFGYHDAPDSTAVMSVEDLIKEVKYSSPFSKGSESETSQFDLSAMTHRSSSLDPTKLEYINKRHLMQTWSNPEGLQNLAEKVHEEIKERFPTR